MNRRTIGAFIRTFSSYIRYKSLSVSHGCLDATCLGLDRISLAEVCREITSTFLDVPRRAQE